VLNTRFASLGYRGQVYDQVISVTKRYGRQRSGADVCGANYYPGRGEEGCMEYTALINIRPAQGNRGMLIADADVCTRVRDLVFELIGPGEALG
jgi:hypothetical protein